MSGFIKDFIKTAKPVMLVIALIALIVFLLGGPSWVYGTLIGSLIGGFIGVYCVYRLQERD